MKRAHLILLAACAASLAGAEPAAEAPTAPQLLREVLAQLPRESLHLQGRLRTRKRHGIVTREVGFDLSVQWGRSPSVAAYTIRDALGRDLERLVVERDPQGPPRLQYFFGDPLAPAAAPDLAAAVRETDVSWFDLTLSFLWWEGRSIVRSEEVKGRDCYVVEVAPPAGAAAPYARGLLWIDRELRVLLQAEGYDGEGRLLRRLWVKSVKKVEDRWMIKDMEIQAFPAVTRTELSVQDVDVGGPP